MSITKIHDLAQQNDTLIQDTKWLLERYADLQHELSEYMGWDKANKTLEENTNGK
jgi:hypothetical protein